MYGCSWFTACRSLKLFGVRTTIWLRIDCEKSQRVCVLLESNFLVVNGEDANSGRVYPDFIIQAFWPTVANALVSKLRCPAMLHSSGHCIVSLHRQCYVYLLVVSIAHSVLLLGTVLCFVFVWAWRRECVRLCFGLS